MSQLAIQKYHQKLENLIQYGGSRNERSIRRAFESLLDMYCHKHQKELVAELEAQSKHGNKIIFDGVVRDAYQQDWGYWEAKDEKDDLNEEIQAKFAKGYPNDNILFEDSKTAILIQAGQEVRNVDMQDWKALDKLLNQFFAYERPEIKDFHKAIAKFQENLPVILDSFRKMLAEQHKENRQFNKQFKALFESCRESVNPNINQTDIDEMMIQHILTEDIFLKVFSEPDFHQDNPIASELSKVIKTFFTQDKKRNFLGLIEHFYKAIQQKATQIANHHEKQKFLKALYEQFYKIYNPKGADRLGIVYTPNEIVRFMIESVDVLLDKHSGDFGFNRLLGDKGVEILDPATGTGTFVTELIEYLPKSQLRYKYKNEIYCNEVSILPYYVANLNIEYTFKQKMGEYVTFPNICFVDTLDNMGFDYDYQNKQEDMVYEGFSEENAERIERQNQAKISVIIGNPPYNANQQNENDNNKNRAYEEIDEAIKRTYIDKSSAQKTKMYDMYTRFIRWATNRLDDKGIIAFIVNRSFIDSRQADGLRQALAEDFDAIYIVDTQSDVRKNPKISGTQHNIFGIQTGVAVLFLVRFQKRTEEFNKLGKKARIWYKSLPDEMPRGEKLAWFTNGFNDVDFERIEPDKNHNWLNLTDNDFDDLLPLMSKQTKAAKTAKDEQAIFKLFSYGVVTSKDDWMFDINKNSLVKKVSHFINDYNRQLDLYEGNLSKLESSISWSEHLKNKFNRLISIKFEEQKIRYALYRPFTKKNLYFDNILNDRRGVFEQFFPQFNTENQIIAITSHSQIPFSIQSTNMITCIDVGGRPSYNISLYRYEQNKKIENITDWGLKQFHAHYSESGLSGLKDAQDIEKIDIFYYVYAVLHNPAYREKYAMNLKRDYPRIPFYDDFNQWRDWGKALMQLHIDYEKVEKYPLDIKNTKLPAHKPNKAKLKADKINHRIILDDETTLHGIPEIAWTYQLGNRSALEWILDQYKEKKPRDPTIRDTPDPIDPEKKRFNTYKFADYKPQVIELLQRICTVSVETMHIIQAMQKNDF
jgi:predicted helicase